MPLSGTFKLEPDWHVGDAGMLLKRKVIEQTGPHDHEGAGRSRFWDQTPEQRRSALAAMTEDYLRRHKDAADAAIRLRQLEVQRPAPNDAKDAARNAELHIAVEYGFRSAEKGWSLVHTLTEFAALAAADAGEKK